MTKRYIQLKDLTKILTKLSDHVSENEFEDVTFAYTVTDYYVTFKMSREDFDDLNNMIKGRTL